MRNISSDRDRTDEELWNLVLQGDPAAFEAVVDRHKGTVSAVAYCFVSDLARCQDISQETFWTAWKNRLELIDKSKLASWLCGIARNLARQSVRKESSQRGVQDVAYWDVSSQELDPAIAAITKEENDLVWQSLESIPESYREAIVIYYRQGESIASMASALEISIDAAKQRLSRAREMLRTHLSGLVEDVLHRSVPSQVFTARVMIGVAAWTSAIKAGSVSAASLGTAAGTAAGVLNKGAVGSILGTNTSAVATVAGSGMAGMAGGVVGGA
ncbi:MAG: sigma-70 family RNA polymerase sigma factor, partial [Pirellula sp.]